jgi:hypothetical protein
MEEMDEYYSFKKTHFTPGLVELPCEDLLEYYLSTLSPKNSFPVLNRYGKKYISMPICDVDYFCEWINDARVKSCHF